VSDLYAEQSKTYAENHSVLVQGGYKQKTVVVDSGNVDSGSTPTSVLREGNVLVKRTSTGRYVEANDSNGDRNTGAVVTAAEAADAGWQSKTITCTINGGKKVTVTLGGADDTNAEVATALNADADFARHYLADGSGALLTITSLETGADIVLEVTSNLSTAFGASGTQAYGEWADYGVLHRPCDLTDEAGSASHSKGSIVYAHGRFDESQLINLTGDARRALQGRGCSFE